MQRRGADLALRRVDDTQEGAVVVRVGQHAQIGQQIFNFRAREERRAAGDFVRDAVLHQHLFKDPRLVIAAIKDRIVFVIGFINKVVGDQFPGHALRFMIFIVGGEHFQLSAVSQFGKQTLFKNVRVVGDQNVSGFQNTPGGAIVLLKLDNLQRREVLAEQHQVLWPRAAPRVDRLVIVAYHGKTRPLAHQQLHQLILAGVGILILIHQQVADLILPAFAHLLVALQQQRRQQDQIVKIEDIAGLHMRIVQSIAVGEYAVPFAFRTRGGLGRGFQIVFPVGDRRDQLLEHHFVIFDQPFGQLFEQRHLVGIVE